MHCIVETPDYLADCKAAGITETERSEIGALPAVNPFTGVLTPGTGGARKLRFAARSKGKNGGCRIITFYGSEDIPLFLLNVSPRATRSICLRQSVTSSVSSWQV